MKLSRGAMIALLAAAVAIAMGFCVRNGFVYDDIPAIVQNTRVTDPGRWHTIPRSPYWLGTLWRPFTVTMYAVQWLLGRGQSWFFHLTSLVAYVAVGVLLFSLLENFGTKRVAAFAATLLFLVHPVHVEAVASAVGQSELWVALALIAATSVYVRARQDHTERKSLFALLALVALGIVSKEQGFIAPLLLAGAEWLLFADRKEPIAARVRLLVPVSALAALMFVVRGILLNSNVGETPAIALTGLSLPGRALTFLGVIPELARLVVWPLHLQADYGPPAIPVGGPMTLRHMIGLMLLVGFVVLFFRWRKREPIAAVGLFWAAVALAPVSNLLTPTGIVMAERVLFLPTVGLAIVAAAIVPQYLTAPTRTRVFAVVAIAWGALLAVRSIKRVPVWSTQAQFFTAITRDGAQAYRGWKVSAEYWDEVHDRPRAIAELKHSIELWPHDYEVFERLGQLYRQDGHCDMAIPIFADGVKSAPDASTVRAKLIECLLTEKHFDEAQRVADEAVAAGQDEFKPMQVRVRTVRERADSSGHGAPR